MNTFTVSSGFTKYFFKTGVPFGVLMGVFFSVMGINSGVRWLLFSIPLGLLSGVLFGLTMAAFMLYQVRKFSRYDPSSEGELLLRHGAANHFKNGEGRGGYLYLTDRRLIFVPHKFNVQRDLIWLPSNSIAELGTYRSLGMIPNGLVVRTATRTERFAVEDRTGWINALDTSSTITQGE